MKALAQNGASVYLAARNQQKGSDAIERIDAARLLLGNGKIELLELDLATPTIPKAVVEEFLKKELNILVKSTAVYVHISCFGV